MGTVYVNYKCPTCDCCLSRSEHLRAEKKRCRDIEEVIIKVTRKLMKKYDNATLS